MSDVLPLLLLPVLGGWFVQARVREAALRRDALRALGLRSGAALLDAGRASVFMVARSLAVGHSRLLDELPPARRWLQSSRAVRVAEFRRLVAPLGLEVVEVMQPRRLRFRGDEFVGRTYLLGHRHGRMVEVVMSTSENRIRVVGGPHPTTEVSCAAGCLVPADDAPVGLRTGLIALACSPRWSGVSVHTGEGGVLVTRPAGRPHSWMHDLWLAEFVADLLANAQPTPHAPALQAVG